MSGGLVMIDAHWSLLVPRLCLGTHWCGGSCLPSSQTKNAFRRGRATIALRYQTEPQSLVTRSHSATKLAIRVTSLGVALRIPKTFLAFRSGMRAVDLVV